MPSNTGYRRQARIHKGLVLSRAIEDCRKLIQSEGRKGVDGGLWSNEEGHDGAKWERCGRPSNSGGALTHQAHFGQTTLTVLVPLSSTSISSCNKMGLIRTHDSDECRYLWEWSQTAYSHELNLVERWRIILLSQNGKVAAYALGKVLLGPAESERRESTVRIRQALIYRTLLPSLFCWISKYWLPLPLQPALQTLESWYLITLTNYD